MNCHICKKEFSRMSNLYKHQRVTKCSRAVKCDLCNFEYVDQWYHMHHCNDFLKNKVVELERINTELRKDLENRISVNELYQQLNELKKKVDKKQ
jgi:hypothetical protein